MPRYCSRKLLGLRASALCGVDPAAVGADVRRKLLLRVCQLSAKPLGGLLQVNLVSSGHLRLHMVACPGGSKRAPYGHVLSSWVQTKTVMQATWYRAGDVQLHDFGAQHEPSTKAQGQTHRLLRQPLHIDVIVLALDLQGFTPQTVHMPPKLSDTP